jgi:hypothetical protein
MWFVKSQTFRKKHIASILRVNSKTSNKPARSRLAYSSTINMEETSPSEISKFSKLQRYNTEDGTLDSHRCEKFKSNISGLLLETSENNIKYFNMCLFYFFQMRLLIIADV